MLSAGDLGTGISGTAAWLSSVLISPSEPAGSSRIRRRISVATNSFSRFIPSSGSALGIIRKSQAELH